MPKPPRCRKCGREDGPLFYYGIKGEKTKRPICRECLEQGVRLNNRNCGWGRSERPKDARENIYETKHGRDG